MTLGTCTRSDTTATHRTEKFSRLQPKDSTMTQTVDASRLQRLVLAPVWRTEYRCVGCGQPLNWDQRVGSQGTCPLCGFRGDGACTITATTSHPYKLVRSGPWWRFWVKPKRVYAVERTVDARSECVAGPLVARDIGEVGCEFVIGTGGRRIASEADCEKLMRWMANKLGYEVRDPSDD